MLKARTRTRGWLRPLGCAVLLSFGLGTGPLLAQATAPDTQAVRARFVEFQAGVDEKAVALANEPAFKQLSPRDRNAGIEFLVGNMLFVVAHEMGHAVISELKLPVLGREEDAADTFAIIAALTGVANDFSYRVLEESTKGWFWTARRDKRQGAKPSYHDRHALDEQRAYQIVCLMVGSDPARFKTLADEVKLPEERRRTCGWDFDTAAQSWSTLLAPHRGAAGQPKTAIEVSYCSRSRSHWATTCSLSPARKGRGRRTKPDFLIFSKSTRPRAAARSAAVPGAAAQASSSSLVSLRSRFPSLIRISCF